MMKQSSQRQIVIFRYRYTREVLVRLSQVG